MAIEKQKDSEMILDASDQKIQKDCDLNHDHCKCVLVTGLSKVTTVNALSFYFENPRKGCGEEPSKIELDEYSGRAWVHFVNCSALEKLQSKKDHSLDGAELKIEPFHSFLEQDVCIKKIDVHPEIMAYIKTHYQKELQSVLDENALELRMQWKQNETTALITPRIASVREEKAAKENAVQKLEEFLKDFNFKTFTVESDLFEQVENGLQTDVKKNEAREFELSFDAARFTVNIVGKKESTAEMTTKIEDFIKREMAERRIKETVAVHTESGLSRGQLAVLKKSGHLDLLQETYQHTKIDINDTYGNMVIHSPQYKIHEIIAEVLRFVAKVDKEVVRLSERVLDVILSSKGAVYMSKAFKNIDVVAFIDEEHKTKNKATVYAKDSDQCRKAVDVIHSLAKEKRVRLKEESMKVIKEKKWKQLIDKQQDELVIHVVQDKIHPQTLWISGIEHDVQTCYENVNKHIDQYTIFHDYVDVSPGNLKFLFKVWDAKPKKIMDELKESFLKIKPNYKEVKIEMSGNHNGIKIGKEKLLSCIRQIRNEEVVVDKPGMPKFFRSRQGLKDLQSIERDHSCTIEVMVGKDHLAAPVASQDFEVICSETTPEGKTLSVCKDDLTKHPVDVIVNAANEHLKHSGGLAGAVVRVGGKQIQDECDAYTREHGKLQTGDVIATDSGALPCQRIIHAVGPRWDTIAKQQHAEGQKTKQEELLYKAIQNSLSIAKDYQSIAIPAVSSGIFGVPVDLCARTLIKSTIDFFKLNPRCKLSEARFTNIDDPTVEAFQVEMNRVFGGGATASYLASSTEAIPNSTSKHEPGKTDNAYVTAVTPAPHDNDSAFVTPEGVSICIKVGDISREQSDVLVNTTGTQLNLQTNNCAKAFSKAAGPELQKFCDGIAPVQVGDIGITKPGKLNCKHVFHVVCSEWNNGSGQQVLCSLLEKCLKEAESQRASSISIPAIGTGVLGFPRDAVARISFDEVIKFSRNQHTKQLKEVQFVVYHMDQPTVQAFQDELNRRRRNSVRPRLPDNTARNWIPNEASSKRNSAQPIPEPTTATSKNLTGDSASHRIPNSESSERSSSASIQTPAEAKTRKPKFYEVKMGKMTVQVEKGDITNETTDAIGMFSDPVLDFENQGSAWEALMKCDGRNITQNKQALHYKLPIKHGNCVVFDTKHLQVGHLIICSSDSKKPKKFSRHLEACLKEAEKKELASISFPALGSGNLGLSSKDCADFMLSAARNFSRHPQPKSLKLIRIVVFQEDMIGDFVTAMRNYAYTTTSAWKVVKRGLTYLITHLNQQNKGEQPVISEMSLRVYGGSPKSLSKAVRAINDIMNDKCVLQRIADKEAVLDIDESYMYDISTLEQRLACRINVDKEKRAITVEGLSEDVMEAMTAIHDMLHKIVEAKHERDKAESIAKDVQWEYETNEDFTPYSVEANAKIEKAYGNQEECVTFAENGEEFSINFLEMNERSTLEGVETHTAVRRKDLRLQGINVPDHWDVQPKDSNGVEKGVHLVQLDAASPEFVDVQKQFTKSCRMNITKISRVQNPAQYKIYATRKQQMDERNGSNERQLFHGTAAESCENINQNGFNRSYCGKNAIVYGAGVYFAVDAKYSARNEYSPADSNGTRCMYLARVLTGEYAKGHPSMIEPPPKNPAQPGSAAYDSTVNDISNPGIFVVFKDGQAYPEYLIEFQ